MSDPPEGIFFARSPACSALGSAAFLARPPGISMAGSPERSQFSLMACSSVRVVFRHPMRGGAYDFRRPVTSVDALFGKRIWFVASRLSRIFFAPATIVARIYLTKLTRYRKNFLHCNIQTSSYSKKCAGDEKKFSKGRIHLLTSIKKSFDNRGLWNFGLNFKNFLTQGVSLSLYVEGR